MSLEPTFFGYVATSNDALLIFEACRQNQILQKVSRRPHDRERDRLIKSGNIFVFDEQSSGIRRWTDGVAWSPSRILGNYLIYRQLERPLQPGEKKRAHKNRLSNGGQRSGSDNPELESPERIKSDISPGRSPSPREAGGPIRTHTKKIKSDSSSNASDNGSVPASGKPRRWSEEQEKELAGSLTDSYGFKEGGLIKKTMSVEYEGSVHHLVSYYTIDDVMLSRLPLASQDPRLADLVIGSDLMTRTNFRVHPNSEAGPTVSRNSPTQQRTQMLLQHQRRADDPRQGPGYGPMGYSAPPPVHGNMPPDGYADPNNHYAYGPGPQAPYHRGYYPPQPASYQPIFMHGAPPPPHMVNAPYYAPQIQGPPQYPPGPPQHPPHQPVEVKREGPQNPQYYGAYNPYTPTSSHQSTQQQMYPGHYPPRGPPPPQQQQQPPQIVNARPYEPQGYQGNQGNQGENRPAAPAPPQQRFDGPQQQQNQNTTGGSPRPTATVPPATSTTQPVPPPPTQQAQPLSRHNSSGGAATPVQGQPQGGPPAEPYASWSTGWAPQPNQTPTAARAS